MPKVVQEYKEEARSKIVEAALRAFSESGYHQTTMEDIAQELRVSKGALYLYFESKEELLRACCEVGPQVVGEALQSAFKDRDLIENSEKFFDIMTSQSVWTPNLNFETLSEASRNTVLRKMLRENYDRILEVVSLFLVELEKKGVVKKKMHSRLLARGLIALYDGLMASLIVGVEKSEVKQTWTETIRAMMYGVLVK